MNYETQSANLESKLNGNSDLEIWFKDGYEMWDFRCDGYAILVTSSDPDANLAGKLQGEYIGDSGVVDIARFEAEFKAVI